LAAARRKLARRDTSPVAAARAQARKKRK